MINPELLHVHAHDAKHVLSFATLRNCWDPNNPLRPLIILPVLQNVIHRRNGEMTRRPIPRKPPRDIEKDDKNASKPVARHLNVPNHSEQHMAVCGHSLHPGSMESRKTLSRTKIYFSNQHSQSSRYQQMLFI